jgi:hypothetical protein
LCVMIVSFNIDLHHQDPSFSEKEATLCPLPQA